MMMNLFSSFDPSTGMNLSLNWMSTFIGIIIIPPLFWFIPSRLNMMWIKITTLLHKEFKILINNNKSHGSTLMFISLFSLILFNNFLGLFPYIFTSTSQLVLTLTLALPLWLSFMIFGWISNTMHMFTHLVPQGTPNLLMPFMVLIESINNIIRPGTLSIRLSANMIAGHLLMTLVYSSDVFTTSASTLLRIMCSTLCSSPTPFIFLMIHGIFEMFLGYYEIYLPITYFLSMTVLHYVSLQYKLHFS